MDKQTILVHERIAIGISACCMGCPVRYNAKGWDLTEGMGREKSDFKWNPVCPECMAGLGVPREPIRVTGGDGSMVWIGEAEVKNRRGFKVTEDVKAGALACMEALKRAHAIAFVYMDGSPTCGVYRTTLKSQRTGHPPGVFGSILLENGFFLIPANDLQSPLKWWDWKRRLLAFYWLSKLPIETKNDLYDVWYRLKFLCQELNDTWARETGRTLAQMTDDPDPLFIEKFRKDILDLLRKPSTTKKMTNALWRSYSYYKKAKGLSVDGIESDEFRKNVTKVAEEMLLLERTAIENEIMLGTTPVLYRQRRRLPKEIIDEENEELKLDSDDSIAE